MSEARKGTKRSAKAKAKTSATLRAKGHRPSQACIEAGKASWQNGRISPMTGKRHSEKTKRKMRAAFRKRREAGIIYRGGNGGHHHTEETKAKLREARLRQPDPRLGKRHSPETIEKIRLALADKVHNRDPDTGRFVD